MRSLRIVPFYASKASPYIGELVLFPRNILRGKGFHISKLRAGNVPALYRIDLVHGRLKRRSMAGAEVGGDASYGSLCRPSHLYTKVAKTGPRWLGPRRAGRCTKVVRADHLLGTELWPQPRRHHRPAGLSRSFCSTFSLSLWAGPAREASDAALVDPIASIGAL